MTLVICALLSCCAQSNGAGRDDTFVGCARIWRGTIVMFVTNVLCDIMKISLVYIIDPNDPRRRSRYFKRRVSSNAFTTYTSVFKRFMRSGSSLPTLGLPRVTDTASMVRSTTSKNSIICFGLLGVLLYCACNEKQTRN